jgi:hypothetical protein
MKTVLDLSWQQKEVQSKNHNRTFHLSQKPDILKCYQHPSKVVYAISPIRLARINSQPMNPPSNISLVQAAVMDGLGDTGDEDRASLGEIGNGACDLQDSVIRAG